MVARSGCHRAAEGLDNLASLLPNVRAIFSPSAVSTGQADTVIDEEESCCCRASKRDSAPGVGTAFARSPPNNAGSATKRGLGRGGLVRAELAGELVHGQGAEDVVETGRGSPFDRPTSRGSAARLGQGCTLVTPNLLP